MTSLLVDTTRVVLGKDGGYINANFINMSVKDENFMYIACQGPLPTTLGDFWQMVWEQKSNVIAMMTQEVEGGKVKCQRYWPDTPRTAEMVDDRLQITLIKDQHLDNFVIRVIEVKDVQVNMYHVYRCIDCADNLRRGCQTLHRSLVCRFILVKMFFHIKFNFLVLLISDYYCGVIWMLIRGDGSYVLQLSLLIKSKIYTLLIFQSRPVGRIGLFAGLFLTLWPYVWHP